jgi:hypothetical protein
VSAAFNISLYATAGDRSFTLKIGNVVRGGESEAGPYAARAADPCKKAKVLRFHERGEIGTVVIGRSRRIICESLAALIERYRKDTVPPSRRTLGGRLKTDPQLTA